MLPTNIIKLVLIRFYRGLKFSQHSTVQQSAPITNSYISFSPSPSYRMAGSVLCPVSLSVPHSFPNAPVSSEEDEENEIYCSSRGEGQFISDLCYFRCEEKFRNLR